MKSLNIGHFLFLLGISIWLGGMVFLGYGVASVNFQTAEEWQIQGINPIHPELEQGPRNIAGELTARSIARLNQLEFAGLLLCTIGVAFFWYPRFNRPQYLSTQTILLALMLFLFLIYGVIISGQLTEIRETHALDFSPDSNQLSAYRLEFDRLHAWYTRLSGINVILAVAQLGIAAAQYSGLRYGVKDEE